MSTLGIEPREANYIAEPRENYYINSLHKLFPHSTSSPSFPSPQYDCQPSTLTSILKRSQAHVSLSLTLIVLLLKVFSQHLLQVDLLSEVEHGNIIFNSCNPFGNQFVLDHQFFLIGTSISASQITLPWLSPFASVFSFCFLPPF